MATGMDLSWLYEIFNSEIRRKPEQLCLFDEDDDE